MKLNPVSMFPSALKHPPVSSPSHAAPHGKPASPGAAEGAVKPGASPVNARSADAFISAALQAGRASLPSAKDAFSTGQAAQPSASQPTDSMEPGMPKATDKRPAGDTRSAAQIVDECPALKSLGRQKDIKFDELCKQTGVDPKMDVKDSRQNPDAVYRMSKVLEFIDSSKMSTGGDRTGKVQGGKGDGNIEGITKSGDARHGTEAGMLKDFAEKGYGSLSAGHELPTTKDSHVKADGSNKDNFQWFAGEVGKKLWFIPGLSNVLTGVGNSEGGFLGALKGGLGGMVKTWKGAAEGILDAFKGGRMNPLTMALGAYKGALGETDAAPQAVKDITKMLP